MVYIRRFIVILNTSYFERNALSPHYTIQFWLYWLTTTTMYSVLDNKYYLLFEPFWMICPHISHM